MTRKSLAEWLLWQESLSPRAIDLGLDRVQKVARQLALEPPADSVFTVAGTNGKGSTVSFLESLMSANGRSTGVYTSPHLVRYNERIRVNRIAVPDRRLVEAFETVEAARDDEPLTYFEFGTLAAMVVFAEAGCRVWLLEVGLGGRLDAVNAIDPDYSLITTVALDHQEWLGQTRDDIAAEKAGIMRPATPAFYGDRPVPGPIESHARELDAKLRCLGSGFDYEAGERAWTWRGERQALSDLPHPHVADGAQMRNISLALAAVEAYDPSLLDRSAVSRALRSAPPPGRFQVIEREHQWILDVAHNPQAAKTLAGRLQHLDDPRDTTAVVGMLVNKQADSFIRALSGPVDRWVVCSVEDPRAESGPNLAALITGIGDQLVTIGGTPDESFDLAVRRTDAGGRILVCGSFRIVGPALRWLGLY